MLEEMMVIIPNDCTGVIILNTIAELLTITRLMTLILKEMRMTMIAVIVRI